MAKKAKEKLTLKEIADRLSDEQMAIAAETVQNSVFMEKQLKALRKRIAKEGVDETYQYGSKPTAAMDMYLKIQKQYVINIRFLADLVNAKPADGTGDELLDFLKK